MTPWRLPNADLLPRALTSTPSLDAAIMGARLAETLTTLGAPCEVSRVVVGPSVARYEFTARERVKMRDFRRLDRADDLAYALGVEHVQITAPIPGRSAVGIDVPMATRKSVLLGDLQDPIQEAA